MLIEGKIEFEPSEIEEMFNAIVGIGAKVKLGMGMKSKISDANHNKWKDEEKEKHARDYYETRIKEMQQDHKAELKMLKAEIEKLKESKKDAKKPTEAK